MGVVCVAQMSLAVIEEDGSQNWFWAMVLRERSAEEYIKLV
jgi:hypothetical protein